MNKERQRIAIAEACGWGPARPHPSTGRPIWDNPHREIEDWATFNTLPDYLFDLNSMHEAEKALTTEQQANYGERILELVKYTGRSVYRDIFNMAHITAAQRAEAFLKAIGKWEE